MKTLHIITGLDIGGAEMMLFKILSCQNKNNFKSVVVSLTGTGAVAERLKFLGIPVHCLHLNKISIKTFKTIIAVIHELDCDLIQGWMYHGNLAAQLASIGTLQGIPTIWNVRHSVYSLKHVKKRTSLIVKGLCYLSRHPKIIIYNSKTSAAQHEKMGYCKSKSLILPNGFDTNLYRPSIESYYKLRQKLNLERSSFVIGLVARFHPIKDHENFLKAAAILLKKINLGVHFVLVGRNVDTYNLKLLNLIKNLSITSNVHLLGERQDMPSITSGFDLATCSSHSEAFPNVVGEAMSCGVPCVVTDVGDSAWIVGNTGKVVPPRNPEALAHAWRELIDLGVKKRQALGQMARARIIENFSLKSVVAQYETLYQTVVN